MPPNCALSLGFQGRDLAYRGLVAGFQDADIHFGYISLFLSRDKKGDPQFEKEVADVGCTVHLQRGEEHVAYTIIETAPGPAMSEIALDNPIAAALLGRKRGDEIVLKNMPIEELRYVLTDVQSKYVYAFQDAIAKFSRRFPAHPGLSSMQFDPSDPSKLLAVLERRRQVGSDATEKYFSRTLPMALLATLVGRSVTEVWDVLSNSGAGQIVTTLGNPLEVDEQAAALAECNGATFDATCLLGLNRAGVLDLLPRTFERVLFAQPLADEVAEELLMLSSGLSVAGTIHSEYGGIQVSQTAPEQIEQHRRDLEAINQLVFSTGQLGPTPSILTQTEAERRQMRQVFGKSTSGAIQVAQDGRVCLCADDAVLRVLAKDSWAFVGPGPRQCCGGCWPKT